MSTSERKGWRSSPLAKRLPLLVLAALGLWLWQITGTPERELVLQPTGPGWEAARALDLQVVDSEGIPLKREERFFTTGAPPELSFKVDLPAGAFRAVLFVKLADREQRVRIDEPLTVGEERYIVRQLQLPPATR
ncbi:hypothetical protein LZ198_39115 [Myxococcus sp. K15C18031901]|uniref:hypothetical protein n=1 Tax=Myxococcus dinghuensis TaxID=2906761 RepID=UPI0020A8048C|nr:hypothetical protein [Myxococcus dinghuensis]MCP3104894.1 hypothetical protein [Myxococcus dinghuensis]